MGVPKFFRFISERYPCLSEVVKEYEIPEFDNFYIDANGIIHNCSHPDDSVHFRISEEEIFKDIFYYFEVLFRLIQPKKLFFIAIDGVAPRAKMNQQRSRRFRTAKDAELAEKRARERGDKLPETDRFDSNCITPGTEFMDRLHKQLQYFIKLKISTEETWQKPKIILSGHNVPGEGEHKIMDYIRFLRSQSDWDPNTRHCLHGLDADLIMLGLCTHEPHFSLLREEVKFSSNAKKPRNVEDTKFYLLHLSMMRGYLDLEFRSLKDKLPFGYDLERIIDDWVLMGFLVGNDFIPSLPKFHIANNALPKLYQAYLEILPTLEGYINDYGTLNLERFEKYLSKLAKIELDDFRDLQADIRYLEGKTEKKSLDEEDEVDCKFDDEFSRLVEESNKMFEKFNNGSPFDSSDDEEFMHEQFRNHKAQFYKDKLHFENVDSEVLRSQAEGYVRAIQWNLYYYYIGCPSWSWFYPHHYAPYVSDIKDFNDFDLNFDLSTPFLPFQQLLAVLPSASKAIVPEPFQNLMASPSSPIAQFYPTEFETDLNDKKNEWEAVVLIPFIEEKALLDAMQPYYKDLTEEENVRNSIQPMEIYEFTPDDQGSCHAPAFFPTIAENYAKVAFMSRSDIAINPKNVVKGILPGAVSGARFGFPQLSGITFTVETRIARVKVFDFPSRGDNFILKIDPVSIDNVDEIYSLANEYRNKLVYVNWPHLQKGKVTAISTEHVQYKIDSNKQPIKYEDKQRHRIDSEELRDRHILTLGIDLQKVDIIIYAKLLEDIRYNFTDSDSKTQGKRSYMWSGTSYPFPYQTCLDQSVTNFIGDDEEIHIGKENDLKEIFSPGKPVFLLDSTHYGKFGKVKSIKNETLVEVSLKVEPNLDLSGILELSRKTELVYYSSSLAAQRLGIGGQLFSRLTGCVLLQNEKGDEKVNVGLGLKFTKQAEELIGYTRREGNFWLYSEKAIALFDDYMAKFPELFEHLQKKTENDVFLSKTVYPDNTEEKVNEIKTWIKAQSHNAAARRPFGSQILTPEAMKEIEKRIIENYVKRIEITQQVEIKPSSLYLPNSRIGKAPPDRNVSINLLDRVISVRKNHSIPLGLMGTVVGIDKHSSNSEKNPERLYDILFDSPVIGGTCGPCNQPRIYRLPYQSFIDITYGAKKLEKRESLPPTVKMATNQATPGENWRNSNFNNSPQSENQIFRWNKGNESVKQFMQNFHSAPKEKVSVVQHSQTRQPDRRSSGANVEFQAMWNVLQNQQLPDDKSLRPDAHITSDPVLPIETQTNALKKILRIAESPVSPGSSQPFISDYQQLPQHGNSINRRSGGNIPSISSNNYVFNQGNVRPKTCSHINCYAELRNICINKNIMHPQYSYKHLASSGEFTCVITFFNDIGTVIGDSCRNKDEAAEKASCKAIKKILSSEEVVKSPDGYRRISQPQQSQPSVRYGQPSNNRMAFNQLPTPPMQWYSCRGGLNPMHFSPGLRKFSPGTSQEMVRHSKSVISPIATTTPLEDPRGKEGERKEEDSLPHSNKGLMQPMRPNHVRRPIGRARSRIAANFSVPLAEKK